MHGALRPVFALALALGTLPAAGCAGEIEFGTDRDASLSAPDTGLARDTGVVVAPDTGVDAGVVDTGVGDTGVGPVDGGGSCTFPAAWPFARDKATYKAKLYDWVSAQPPIKCNSNLCHGGSQAPLIPYNEADLDTPATLNAAIDALWATIPPTLQPEGVTESSLSYRHKATSAGGPGVNPPYSADQQTFLDALVQSACQ